MSVGSLRGVVPAEALEWVAGTSICDDRAMPEALSGRLLVATPLLEDGNFRRAVVLVCSHDQTGAFGVILNRPLDELVEAHLPRWAGRSAPPRVLFGGGPVETNRVIALGRRRSEGETPGWAHVAPGIGLLDLGIPPEELAPGVDAIRLFAGYAGWGSGQLEHEIEQDSWFVVDAFPRDVFAAEPRDLWRTVLRRQASPLAIYATFPEDTALN